MSEQHFTQNLKSRQQVKWGGLFTRGSYVRVLKKIENPFGGDLPAGEVLIVKEIEDGANNTAWIVCSSKKYGAWKIRPGNLRKIEEGLGTGGRYRILLQNRALEELKLDPGNLEEKG